MVILPAYSLIKGTDAKAIKKISIINDRFYNQLKSLLQSDPANFNIAENGQIFGAGNRKLKETSYKHVIDHLTGKRDEEPKGFRNVMSKLQENEEYKEMVEKSKQVGAGKKRIIVRIKHIKRNLDKKSFKPKIWEKL